MELAMPPLLLTLGGPNLNLGAARRKGVPPTLCGVMPPPVQQALRIGGITKDSAGAPLAGCTVQLFRRVDKSFVEEVVSDGSGVYVFSSAGLSQEYQVVAYKAGGPDVAGVTVNTLVGT